MLKNINTYKKLAELKSILSCMESVAVAYSGGVDSAFLLKVAHDVLGDKVMAVIARSATYQKREYKDAVALARRIGVKLVVIETDELNNPLFRDNPPDRCYHCKKELMENIKKIAKKEGYKYIVYGATKSDEGDFRPGQRAAKEMGARAPLVEAGLYKEEVRKLSKKMGLSTWNKPSMACLASRFPYGNKMDEKSLEKVELAENFILDLGFKNVRVRSYDSLARIEIDRDSFKKIFSNSRADKIIKKLKKLGYKYVTLDLEGFRSGSMNEDLKDKI